MGADPDIDSDDVVAARIALRLEFRRFLRDLASVLLALSGVFGGLYLLLIGLLAPAPAVPVFILIGLSLLIVAGGWLWHFFASEPQLRDLLE